MSEYIYNCNKNLHFQMSPKHIQYSFIFKYLALIRVLKSHHKNGLENQRNRKKENSQML